MYRDQLGAGHAFVAVLVAVCSVSDQRRRAFQDELRKDPELLRMYLQFTDRMRKLKDSGVAEDAFTLPQCGDLEVQQLCTQNFAQVSYRWIDSGLVYKTPRSVFEPLYPWQVAAAAENSLFCDGMTALE